MKLRELADLIGGTITGDPDVEITSAASIREAGKGDITFLSDRKHLSDLLASEASAVIAKGPIDGTKASLLISDNPYFTFAKALEVFFRKTPVASGISEKAVVGSGVSFGRDVTVHAGVHICNGVTVGSGVIIHPGVYIGEGSTVGDDTLIYPNVTIRENVIIGKKVIIHSGTVVGSDGFGYVFADGMHYKIPQVGRVLIGDNVEIGANVTIDRAMTGTTSIGAGTKIDNLVQIAHNVTIGRNCIIIALTGISGSVEIGDGVILAGQVGVRDHVKIGKGAIVGAKSGVTGDIPDGQMYSGIPAIPHKTWLRAQSIFSKLPEYIRRLQQLEQKKDE